MGGIYINYFMLAFSPIKAAKLLTLCRQTPLPYVMFLWQAQKPHRIRGRLQSDADSRIPKPEWFPTQSSAPSAMLLSIASSSRVPSSSQWSVTRADSMGMLKERLQGRIKSRVCTVHSQPIGTAVLNSILIAITSGLCIHGSYRGGEPFMP